MKKVFLVYAVCASLAICGASFIIAFALYDYADYILHNGTSVDDGPARRTSLVTLMIMSLAFAGVVFTVVEGWSRLRDFTTEGVRQTAKQEWPSIIFLLGTMIGIAGSAVKIINIAWFHATDGTAWLIVAFLGPAAIVASWLAVIYLGGAHLKIQRKREVMAAAKAFH